MLRCDGWAISATKLPVSRDPVYPGPKNTRDPGMPGSRVHRDLGIPRSRVCPGPWYTETKVKLGFRVYPGPRSGTSPKTSDLIVLLLLFVFLSLSSCLLLFSFSPKQLGS